MAVQKTKNRRKSNTKSNVSKKEKSISQNKKEDKRNKAVSVIVLTASALLLFFLVLIPGDKIWLNIHNFIKGIFGICSVSLPLLLSYIVISTVSNKPFCSINTKITLTFVLILLLCTAFFIFSPEAYMTDENYFSTLAGLFALSQSDTACGLAGGILGFPFISFIGATGSKIIIILAVTVVFAVLSLDIVSYLRNKAILKKKEEQENTEKLATQQKNQNKKGSEDAAQRVEQYRESRKKRGKGKQDIDIELGPEMPLHPVVSPTEETDKKESPKLKKLKDTLINANKKDNEEDIKAVKNVAQAFMEKNKPDLEIAKDIDKALKDDTNKTIAPDGGGSKYIFPPINLLGDTKGVSSDAIKEELEVNGLMLVDTLKSFGVQTKIVDISRGPAVTRFELQPAAGVKISKITNLADDIALNLAASGVRIEAPIPGKAAVGIEIPNRNVMIVRMKELVSSKTFSSAKSKLTAALGRDIAGNITLADLGKMPHLLIAGSTGSGKSVCINSLIISLLYKSSPDEVKFLMIDPKVVELGIYNGIPHLLVPVVTDARKAAGALNWAVTEMLKRYRIFANCGVRDLHSYNNFVIKVKEGKAVYEAEDGEPLEPMPQIVIIIDELSDLMMAAPHEVEDAICRLAQMARAAGMHLIIATQRPSVDVITGIIKANIPSRIAFAVSSQIDSRTILDMGGAEKLLGRGDMLFSPIGVSKPQRVQGCFVTDEEIERITDFVKKMKESQYDESIIDEIEKNAVMEKKSSGNDDSNEKEDVMFEDAVKCVVEAGQASTSMLQRRLRVGYARAGRLIDEMEQKGIVGPHEGSKPRQVIMTKQQWLERNVSKTE